MMTRVLVDVEALLFELPYDGLAAVFGQHKRKSVVIDRDDAHFDLRDVLHELTSSTVSIIPIRIALHSVSPVL